MAIGLLTKKNKEINKVVLIPVSQICPNPNQPRKYFDEDALQELSRSIITNGLLQPVTVRKIDDSQYELVAGERRLLAFRSLGRQHIPAIIEEYTEEQSATLALIENLQRKNLNYFEEAMGIEKLMQELNLTQQQVSQQLGKAQSTVANKLRLLRYPLTLQERMIASGFTERHARTLLKLPDANTTELAVEYISAKRLNVEQTERYVENLLKQKSKPKKTRLFVVKDMRIFMNSIHKAVGMMNSAGITVETAKKESDDYLEYTLKIPKSEVYLEKPPRRRVL